MSNALKRAAEQLPGGPLPDIGGAAATAGLLDVAYATLDSPVGTLLIARTPAGLVRLAYIDHADEESVLADLAARVSPRVLAAPRKLDEPRRELDQYFAGRREHFDLEIDWSLTRGFGRRVLQATAQIPFGSVSTYKRVATEAGSPQAHRAAGKRSSASRHQAALKAVRTKGKTGLKQAARKAANTRTKHQKAA